MSRVTRGRVLREKQATAQHYTNIEQVNAENATAVAFLRDETSDKITPAMRQSLVDLQNSLTCPLCASVLVQPVSLPACSHTFCCPCIDRYVENSWTCPSKYCASQCNTYALGYLMLFLFCAGLISTHVRSAFFTVKTCNMPVSMKNTHQGKFRNVNSGMWYHHRLLLDCACCYSLFKHSHWFPMCAFRT